MVGGDWGSLDILIYNESCSENCHHPCDRCTDTPQQLRFITGQDGGEFNSSKKPQLKNLTALSNRNGLLLCTVETQIHTIRVY